LHAVLPNENAIKSGNLDNTIHLKLVEDRWRQFASFYLLACQQVRPLAIGARISKQGTPKHQWVTEFVTQYWASMY
jgi:hypothetical protein